MKGGSGFESMLRGLKINKWSNTLPTNLSAVVNGSKLEVSGASADSSGYVYIRRYSSSATVEDNGSVGVLVPIKGAELATHHIDASTLTGTGASIYSSSVSSKARKLTGSAQNDYLTATGYHLTNDRLKGGAGNDTLNGGNGNDRLFGDRGSDTINGGDGDDFLFGGKGRDADTFDGGAGDDTIVLTGVRAEYQIDIVNGLYQISHIGGTRADGIDRFANIENLQFKDQTISESDWGL
ncbi:calcium-binding protein [Pseudooceanicola sp.]|uniref:calcium-binding protein n=1 Tax=Pseudooceanicola sp. TaxID=1914328 RepID=UPI003514A60F